MKKHIYSFLVLLLFTGHVSWSQPSGNEKVKVFLECTYGWLCDFDYVRTEMKMIDFVNDRFASDVHVLVNTQHSSSGGEQNAMNFLGQKRFPGINDTLTYFNDPTLLDDDKRKKMVQYLKLGLMRYIARTAAGKDLQISYTDLTPSDSAKAETVKDKWNFWMFQ